MESANNSIPFVIEKRKIAEASIEAIIDKFQFETGLYVDELMTEHIDENGGVEITLCASLPLED